MVPGFSNIDLSLEKLLWESVLLGKITFGAVSMSDLSSLPFPEYDKLVKEIRKQVNDGNGQ